MTEEEHVTEDVDDEPAAGEGIPAPDRTVMLVRQLPPCEICMLHGTDSERDSPASAVWNAAIMAQKGGGEALMCEAHFESPGRYPSRRGPGIAQKLEVVS